jgi:hypothetical protein
MAVSLIKAVSLSGRLQFEGYEGAAPPMLPVRALHAQPTAPPIQLKWAAMTWRTSGAASVPPVPSLM